jgi:hypothetical protein
MYKPAMNVNQKKSLLRFRKTSSDMKKIHDYLLFCTFSCFQLSVLSLQVPGPGQYEVNQADNIASRIAGGKFNMGNSKNDVDWAIYRGARVPGPGRYDTMRAQRYLTSSPKFSFAGRPAPANMPEPYADFGSTNVTHRSRSVSPTADLNTSSDEKLSGTNKSFTCDPATLERSRQWSSRHTQRMKTAYQEAAVKRRQRDIMGFGTSFFL